MAFIYSTTNNTQNTLSAAEDLGVVTSTGAIVLSAICVQMSGEDARLINDGLIASGNVAVSASNDMRIVNSGTIVGELQAVFLSIASANVTSSVISNSGEITAYAGAAVSSTEAGIRLTNTGLISSTSTAVNFSGSDTSVVNVINNAGTIALNGSSTGNAVSIGGAAQFTNTGLVIGNVALGVGNDILDNRIGEITGTISMGNGDNLFRGGAMDESVTGGGGLDTLRGGDGDDSLSGSTNNDLLVGGEGDDVLNGGIGNDTLRGGAGDDTLIGSGTTDVMAGGLGRDVFVFTAADDSDIGQDPDQIEAFDRKDDVIDLSALTGTPLDFAGNGPLTGGGTASVAFARTGGLLVVSVDITGEGGVDMVFHVSGTTSLAESNFLL